MTMEHTFFLFLLEVTARATTVICLAGLACWMLGRASAAVRHFIWLVAIVGVLVLPALRVVVPKWSVYVPALQSRPVVPIAEPALQSRPAERTESEQVSPVSIAPASPMEHRVPRVESHRAAVVEPISSRAISNRTTSASPDPLKPPPARQASLPFILLALWVAGAAIALCRFAAGHLRLWWIQRHTDPITDPNWVDLSRRVAHQLRLSTTIRLFRCRRPTMPVCWGVRQPSLLLPSDADTWTEARRQIVLLHELAHAKRRDCLTQAIAQVAVAVYWFNPLVWLAVRRLRAERERACDDLVLAAGASAPDYADHLLEIARTFRAGGCPSWAAVAMARPSQLEGRLLAILDRHRDRRTLPRRACAAAVVLALATVATLAAVQPVPASTTTAARSSFPAAAKSRPLPAQAEASATATEARFAFEKQAMPTPAQRPVVLKGVGKGVGEGIGFSIADGVGQTKTLDAGQTAPGAVQDVTAARIAREARLDVDTNEITLAATQGAAAQIGGAKQRTGDNRPEVDPRIVAALATALKDQSVDVRRQAAMTLSQMRSAQAVDALIAAATDADKEVRQFAVHAISRHSSDAITKALVRALKDSDVDVRQAAMLGIARLRDPQYIEVFAEALKDSNADVRQQAAHALAQMRDARTVPALLTALKDADADVRQQAARALGEVGDARAVDPLVAAMKDANGDVRQQIVHALGRIGQGAARAQKERK